MVHFCFCFLTGWGRGFRTALRRKLACSHADGVEGCNAPNGLVKHALEVALGQGRALEVLVRLDILRAEKGLVVRHGLHALLAQGVQGRRVFPEVELGSDEDDGDVGRVMIDLGVPLGKRALGGCPKLRARRDRGRRGHIPWP